MEANASALPLFCVSNAFESGACQDGYGNLGLWPSMMSIQLLYSIALLVLFLEQTVTESTSIADSSHIMKCYMTTLTNRQNTSNYL